MSSAKSGEAPVKVRKEWQTCDQASDCVAAVSKKCGSLALNNKSAGMDYFVNSCLSTSTIYFATCENNVCVRDKSKGNCRPHCECVNGESRVCT